ncbi:MAG: AraC family transcriptional regulator ligand-binding domain-containing protein [Oleispira sp.]|nr:AraC family transcriptional regulator ligand-binding domain-containing protein [Oleispira sp.]
MLFDKDHSLLYSVDIALKRHIFTIKRRSGRDLMTGFVIAAYIQPVLEAFLQQGGRLSSLADYMGVSDLWILNPPQKITTEQYLNLLLNSSQLLQDDHLGIRIGQHAGLANFDVLGQALANTQSKALTLAQALQQVMVLERLVHRLGDSRIQVEGHNIRLIWRAQYQQDKAARLVVESVLAGIIHLAQQLTGRLIPVREVSFVHEKPSDYQVQLYQQGFRADCLFNQKTNSLVIAAEVLAWPLRKTEELFKQAITTEKIVDQIKHLLEGNMMSNLKLAQVAAMLGMGERSLQRKLKQHETSFQQVLATVRLQQAYGYLKYSNLSILHISQLLGFKEQSSFNHFFLQQTGSSPLRYKTAKQN